jgi:hypothetical protein
VIDNDKDIIEALRLQGWDEAADRIEELVKERDEAQINHRIFHLNAEALNEIKAVVDGHSEQSIKAIICDLLAELEKQ